MERAELARRLGGRADTERGCRIVIAETEPARFMAAFAAAAAGTAEVFVTDPGWGTAERTQFEALLAANPAQQTGAGESGWLMLPSGGTGGKLKFARHDAATLAAAVAGFQAHFGLGRVDAVGVLPLHHVSGLLAWLRCALTGGTYTPWDWKKFEAGEFPAVADGGTISLVPTQLQRLLARPAAMAWLQRRHAVFVGGGPAWPDLLDAAAAARLPVALSYGMTETAAMVAALRPAEFLAGERSSGRVLPHARINVNAAGRIEVGGTSLFRGYWPERTNLEKWETSDLGAIDARGCLTVHGRDDAMIITGGKKVQPAEVEAALRASGEVEDVAVLGVPDAEWGEAVAAFFPGGGRIPDLERAGAALAPWQRPKYWVPLAPWPRNAQGKISREALRRAWAERAGAKGRDFS
jgi:O-succinylbenzoic acid--CoA ligase